MCRIHSFTLIYDLLVTINARDSRKNYNVLKAKKDVNIVIISRYASVISKCSFSIL